MGSKGGGVHVAGIMRALVRVHIVRIVRIVRSLRDVRCVVCGVLCAEVLVGWRPER